MKRIGKALINMIQNIIDAIYIVALILLIAMALIVFFIACGIGGVLRAIMEVIDPEFMDDLLGIILDFLCEKKNGKEVEQEEQ